MNKRVFIQGLPTLVLSLLVIACLPSCSTTKLSTEGTDVLIVEQLSARDPFAGTWRIEGAAQGVRTKAEDLRSVSTSGVAWGRLGQEKINPPRDLQGYIDRTEPDQARIEVRQRGLGRWDEWSFNGIYALDGSGDREALEPLPKMQEFEEEGEDGGVKKWFSPSSWNLPSVPKPSLPKFSLPKVNLPKIDLWLWGSKEADVEPAS